MNLIINFSAQKDGNCQDITNYIKDQVDKSIYLHELNIHPCSQCEYQCMDTTCVYHNDDVYPLYQEMQRYDKVFFIVPMYGSNASSLYFILNERAQDYFMHNEQHYLPFTEKLHIIGVYGSEKETPFFLHTFDSWFTKEQQKTHILGIERHTSNQTMNNKIIELDIVKKLLDAFITQ